MKITRKQLFVTASVIAVLSTGLVVTHTGKSPTHSYPPATHQAVSAPTVREIAVDVNNERVKAQLPALLEDSRLDTSAAAKCADMQSKNYVAHDSPTGQTPLDFIKAAIGTTHAFAYGENLSWNYTTSQKAVDGWMSSPGHRANILNSKFTEVGYAICNVSDNYHNVIVQQFIGE